MRRLPGKPQRYPHSTRPGFGRKYLSHGLVLLIAVTTALYGVLAARTDTSPVAALPAPPSRPADSARNFVSHYRVLPVSFLAIVPPLLLEPDVSLAEESTGEESSPETATPEDETPEPAETSEEAAVSTEEEERTRALGLTPVPTPPATATPAPSATPARTPTPQTSRTPTPTPSPSATPTPTRNDCIPSDSPAYCIYTVQNGDTLSGIAARFRLESRNVLGWELLVASNKPDLTSVDDILQPGLKLRIPTASGLVHTVLLDETVGDLADMFDVSSASIIAANNLPNRDFIAIGQVLLIPNPGRTEPPPPPAPPPPTPEPEPEPTATPEPSTAPSEPPPPPPRRPSSAGFIWPVSASVNVTSYFGPRHPLGIDLGLAHAARSPIVAAAAGRVVFAGGNACCSYGLYVIVDHENGFKTLYAYLSRIDVGVGQWVTQGQSLGPSGSTGYSTGYHLHFEIHRNGVRVNPLAYMP